MYSLKLIRFSIIFLLFSSVIFGQEINSEYIDSLVSKSLSLKHSVGIAIAVVKDGYIIHSKGYGIKSVKTNQKVDENTLFAIASNSKAFTSAALAMLVDEGKLSWQDRVVDYIPEFKMYNDYVTANFNIIDLLTHRSGLGLGAGDLMIFPDGTDFTIKDIITSFQYQKPQSPFRTKFDYDNLLYIVAGEIVNRISGMPWADFIENRIFTPLGMTHSVALGNRLKPNANLAMPHSAYSDITELHTFQGNDIIGAAGGIYSSVNDLSKWLLMQLNKGIYDLKTSTYLFSPLRQREMWSPHTITGFHLYGNKRSENHFSAYALGWELSDKQGKIVVEHTGGLPGMLSRTILVPELNLGIVVLTNSDPGDYAFYAIPETILDAYLDIEMTDWITKLSERAKSRLQVSDSVTKAVWETVKLNKNIPFNRQAYLGSYKDNWFGTVTISKKNGGLWFTSTRSPKLNGPMYFYQATTFVVKWSYTDMPCDAFATFNLNEEGQAIEIKMKGISPNIDFSFDFQDLDLRRFP